MKKVIDETVRNNLFAENMIEVPLLSYKTYSFMKQNIFFYQVKVALLPRKCSSFIKPPGTEFLQEGEF